MPRDSCLHDAMVAMPQVAAELWFLSRKNPNGHPGLVGPIPAGQDGLRSEGFLLYWLPILKPDQGGLTGIQIKSPACQCDPTHWIVPAGHSYHWGACILQTVSQGSEVSLEVSRTYIIQECLN